MARLTGNSVIQPDDGHAEVQRLLLEAGRIMEDSSPALALALPDDPRVISERIEQLATSASDLTALAAAARLLQRQLPDR